MSALPRVAFFADSFHEVNGVALTSRQLDAFARRRGYPFLSVRGAAEHRLERQGDHVAIDLRRGWASFALDRDLRCDPLFLRWRDRVADQLRRFQPDVIHVTGPNDMGILGVYLAHLLRVPVLASWQTNVHQYGRRRLEKLLAFLPGRIRSALGARAESAAFHIVTSFYRLAKVILAPNRELVETIGQATNRPVYLMQRGVDTTAFSPAHRTRQNSEVVLGFVGRVQPEKNVGFLLQVEQALLNAGVTNYRFLIVGDGSERDRLRRELRRAVLPGVLRGRELSEAYANMDVFLFPSYTDTFGNVIQEAMASGVPAIVTAGGGPKFIVRSGETGYVAADEAAFIRTTLELVLDPAHRRRLGAAARRQALEASWDRVFERVYDAYRECIERCRETQQAVSLSPTLSNSQIPQLQSGPVE
ncbi:MAG: glycosyltransferase [Bryobacteraceae bacterium]|nr:glycosyltransferase [Bryobacteraceae bacterium]